jgi:hypothetical protein
MEIIHTHIATKPNTTAMDFQQKKKFNNLLQHKEPSPPKKPI